MQMNSNRGNKRKLSNDGKRAAHVKFDGKTIALGTFPDGDADIVCKRAKVLTKSWRDMYPKPSVEWVKRSLERSGIRLVNDRPGRQPADRPPEGMSKRIHDDPHQTGSFSFTPLSEREDISVPRQIQSALPQSLDSVINTTEGGSKSSDCIVQSGLMLLASSHKPIAKTTRKELGNSLSSMPLTSSCENISNFSATPLLLDGHTSLRDLHQETDDNRITQCSGRDEVTAYQEPRIEHIRANSMVTYQEKELQTSLEAEGHLTLGDLGDIDIEGTYAMLARHHLNLINEIEETSTLMDAYRDECNRRRIRQLDEKGSRPTDGDINLTPT